MSKKAALLKQPEAPVLSIIAPEEHDRSKLIGGSDIAAVLGISPWKTAVDLWKDKSTPRIEGKSTGVKRRGQRWEGVVAEMLVESLQEQGHKVEIVGSNRRYKDETLLGANGKPFAAAEIDFELRLDDEEWITNCELKTVHPFKAKDWGDSGSDDLPIHYTAQVMWGMGVTKVRPRAILAALFGADELRIYPVDFDGETIQALREKALAFWNDHVLAGVAPEPVNIEDLSKIFTTDGAQPALLADEALTAHLLRLRAIRAEITARELEQASLEFEVRRAMGSCTEIILPNGKTGCTWKEGKGTWIDGEALKAANPVLYKEVLREWRKRVFKFNSFSVEGL